MVRRLQHRQKLVAQKPAEADLQERAGGDVIAIEDRQVFTASDLQRFVDIAGLRMTVVGADRPVNPDFFAERLELRPAAVIQHVDSQFVGGVIERERGVDGRLYDRQRLVVSGDEDVDSRPCVARSGQRHRLAIKRPCGLEVAEQQHHRRIDLGRDQQQTPQGVKRMFPVRGGGQSPVHVAARRDHRKHNHHKRRVTALQAPEQQRADKAADCERQLFGERQWHREHEVQHHQREQREADDDGGAAPQARVDQALQS